MDPIPLRRNVSKIQVLSVGKDGAKLRSDSLAGEEPMEIRVTGPDGTSVSVAVTMRTPGSDFELAAGFLFTEGLIAGPRDVATVRYCEVPSEEQQYNVVTVDLVRPFDASRLQRNFYATSSCGICGKASIDQIEVACPHLPPGPAVDADVIASLPDTLRASQKIFEKTGGLHAAGVFSTDGTLIALREDVGRHNAVDKLIGHLMLAGKTPLSDSVLLVSGRVSFEIVQKAAVAGIPILAAVSAPSSLAVQTAERLGMTVVGFIRGDSLNVYSHNERIVTSRDG